MRILLTNHTLGERSGTEVYLRDVALALLARGHQPIAYSRRLGEIASELRRATVPVLDDLAHLERPPDLIHAQHHLETMTALARFPQTPAVYVCHGWLPDEEAPPRHPRILRYVAVDELVRRRLVDECGIAERRVEVLLNFVDLERFQPRSPLPERPARALVFSNYVGDENCLPILRRACEEAGLRLDVIGRAQGTAATAPEELLGRYDVVFAKGRAALEAAAVGAAVILCDVVGLGPMVDSRGFEAQRAFNFGVRLLREPITVDGVRARLDLYDPADAAEVTRRMRRGAGLEASVDRLLEFYEETLAESRAMEPSPEADARAMARYLRRGPLTGGDFHQVERERLLAELAGHQTRTRELRRAVDAMLAEKRTLEEKIAELELERLRGAEAERWLQGEIGARVDERDRERSARTAAETALDQLSRQAERHEAELGWIKNSVLWRLRRAVLSLPGLQALYRALTGGRRSGS